MVVKIVIVILILITLVLILAATKADSFHIQRSLTIQAPPEKIFALIDDFHNWKQWAPQDKEDPTMKRSFSGPDSGVGAVTDWNSSGSAGTGKATILESESPRKITIRVDWVKPMALQNINQFDLEPTGNSTKATWSIQGRKIYVMKLMSVFTNMDKMMGKHFESGLENLQNAVEQSH